MTKRAIAYNCDIKHAKRESDSGDAFEGLVQVPPSLRYCEIGETRAALSCLSLSPTALSTLSPRRGSL